MITRHELKMSAICPVDQTTDVYDVVIETTFVLPVEDICEAIKKMASRKEYQENLTRELATNLRCKVTTTGYHSGVKTTCVI